MKVDLPEPEGPITEMYSLRSIRRSIPCSARTVSEPIWYSLVSPSTRMMGVPRPAIPPRSARVAHGVLPVSASSWARARSWSKRAATWSFSLVTRLSCEVSRSSMVVIPSR